MKLKFFFTSVILTERFILLNKSCLGGKKIINGGRGYTVVLMCECLCVSKYLKQTKFLLERASDECCYQSKRLFADMFPEISRPRVTWRNLVL